MLTSQIQQFLAANPDFVPSYDPACRTASRYFYIRFADWMRTKGARAPHASVVGRQLRSMGFDFGVTNYPRQLRAIVKLGNTSDEYKAFLADVNRKYGAKIMGGCDHDHTPISG